MRQITLFTIFLLLCTACRRVSAQSSISKYAQQIVFSKAPIQTGAENTSSFVTELEPGKDLYYHLYMGNTMQGYIEKWKYTTSSPPRFKYLYVKFYIDNTYIKGVTKRLRDMTDEQFKAMHDFGSVLWSSKESDATDLFSLNQDFKDIMAANADKLNGSHKIKIEILMYDNSHVFELLGTGVLNVKGGPGASEEMAGIKNEFHKQHLKKLLFSAKPMGAELTGTEITGTYTVGQPLYYRVFMDNNWKNYITKAYGKTYPLSFFHSVYLKFYMDGKEIYGESAGIEMTDEQKATLTTFAGTAIYDKPGGNDKMTLDYVFRHLLFKHNHEMSGTHTVKIEMYMYSRDLNKTFDLLGEGELKMTLGAINPTNPVWCHTPKAVVSDPTLEAKMVAAYNAQGQGAGAKKAWLKYTDWEVKKNDLTGAIISKFRNAEILIQTSDGCAYQEATFVMDYEGNDKYGPIHFSGLVPGSYWPILCECVK